jgi:hypothetical protein
MAMLDEGGLLQAHQVIAFAINSLQLPVLKFPLILTMFGLVFTQNDAFPRRGKGRVRKHLNYLSSASNLVSTGRSSVWTLRLGT